MARAADSSGPGTLRPSTRFCLQAGPFHGREHSLLEHILNLIGTLIIGLLVGLVAKFLMPGKDPKGFLITMAIGVAGAFLATFLGQQLGIYQGEEAAGFIGAVIGAILLLIVYRVVAGKRRD